MKVYKCPPTFTLKINVIRIFILECVEYKLFLLGESGAGKSAVTGWLAGLPAWNRQSGESPGLRVTTTYWPAKLHNNIVLFKVSNLS